MAQVPETFAVAEGAFVVETAGRHSAVEPVDPATGGRSISNGLTIAGFAEAYTDRMKQRLTACGRRRARTEHAARRATGPADLLARCGTTARDPALTGRW